MKLFVKEGKLEAPKTTTGKMFPWWAAMLVSSAMYGMLWASCISLSVSVAAKCWFGFELFCVMMVRDLIEHYWMSKSLIKQFAKDAVLIIGLTATVAQLKAAAATLTYNDYVSFSKWLIIAFALIYALDIAFFYIKKAAAKRKDRDASKSIDESVPA